MSPLPVDAVLSSFCPQLLAPASALGSHTGPVRAGADRAQQILQIAPQPVGQGPLPLDGPDHQGFVVGDREGLGEPGGTARRKLPVSTAASRRAWISDRTARSCASVCWWSAGSLKPSCRNARLLAISCAGLRRRRGGAGARLHAHRAGAGRARGAPLTKSPEYLGRAPAALAADPAVLARSGQLLNAGDLAREGGFTDVDGSQPEAFRQ